MLIDASNAFNQMNRSAALHNIQIMCKEMALYVINTYRSPSRLFICGGGEILSREGTTQGDRLAMPWYALNIYKICNNVEIEPRLQPLENERFHLRSAVTSSEARLDIKAGGFWARGVTAFFDVRVTHVNSKCYQSKPTSEVFKEQEEEKKRKY